MLELLDRGVGLGVFQLEAEGLQLVLAVGALPLLLGHGCVQEVHGLATLTYKVRKDVKSEMDASSLLLATR